MSIEHELVQRFHLAIPGLQQWIDERLDQYAYQIKTIDLVSTNQVLGIYSI